MHTVSNLSVRIFCLEIRAAQELPPRGKRFMMELAARGISGASMASGGLANSTGFWRLLHDWWHSGDDCWLFRPGNVTESTTATSSL